MAESGVRRQVPAARERTAGPRAMVVAALVAGAFVAGWRLGRGWGRLTGW